MVVVAGSARGAGLAGSARGAGLAGSGPDGHRVMKGPFLTVGAMKGPFITPSATKGSFSASPPSQTTVTVQTGRS